MFYSNYFWKVSIENIMCTLTWPCLGSQVHVKRSSCMLQRSGNSVDFLLRSLELLHNSCRSSTGFIDKTIITLFFVSSLNHHVLVCLIVNWKSVYTWLYIIVIYLSICLSIYLSIYLSICLSFYLSIHIMKPASNYTYAAIAVLQLCRFLRTLLETALMLW